MLFKRQEIPWEVVENEAIHDVPMYSDESGLELAAVKSATITRTYVLEARTNAHNPDLSNAVIFAQKQLLDEIEQNGYNMLISEGWQITLLRRVKHCRIVVEYRGRPARATNPGPRRDPPYLSVLSHLSIGRLVDSDKPVVHKRRHKRHSLRALISRA